MPSREAQARRGEGEQGSESNQANEGFLALALAFGFFLSCFFVSVFVHAYVCGMQYMYVLCQGEEAEGVWG